MNKETLKAFAKSKTAVAGLASVMSLVGGAAMGAAIAMKRLDSKYAAMAEKEIADAKVFYNTLHKRGPFETPEAAVDELILNGLGEAAFAAQAAEAMRSYQGDSDAIKRLKEKLEVEDLEEGEDDPHEPEESFDLEVENRSPDHPYVITEEEFVDGEPGYQPIDLTYFEGDDTLADDQDKPITDVEGTVGADNLTKFGQGCKEPDIVYIRNERLGVDFEVTKSEGKYTREVLGYIEHSDKPKLRRFRDDD
jgi:hypothetical protein